MQGTTEEVFNVLTPEWVPLPSYGWWAGVLLIRGMQRVLEVEKDNFCDHVFDEVV